MSTKRKASVLKTKKVLTKATSFWNDRELLDLAAALQSYGFSETEKIADAIKTKDESVVKNFLESEVLKLRRKSSTRDPLLLRKNGVSQWARPDSEELRDWPPSRAWRRVLFDQLLPCVKKNDYSKIVMEDLFEAFYNEAEEPYDPQVMNVKAVYKYFLDCIRGHVPAELTPINSAVILTLMGQLMQMKEELDFEEEKEFIKTFKASRNFAPIKIKNEYKERSKKRSELLQNTVNLNQSSSSQGSELLPNTVNLNQSSSLQGEQSIACSSSTSSTTPDSEDDRETIKVVEDMYINLTKHRKLVQSLNPLNVPMWNLVKEQGYIQNKCDLVPRRHFK